MKYGKVIQDSLAVVLALLLAFTIPAQAAVVTNTSIPISLPVYIPCVPESVTLTGNLHVLTSVTVDGNSGLHVDILANPQGISGTGSVTGDKYQGTGETRTGFNVGPAGFPFETTFVNNFKIIGQGTGNNYIVHDTIHLTIDANGNVTATVTNTSVDCK
jgi:hypothetical protein